MFEEHYYMSLFLPIGVVVVMALLAVLWWQQQESTYFPISVVSVNGDMYYTEAEEISESVSGLLKGGFFFSNLNSLKDRLSELPWVASAQVKRQWPDTLTIKIDEEKPLARWDEKGIITTSGKLLFPRKIQHKMENLSKLPVFYGAEDQASNILDMYLLFLEALNPVGLTVQELKMMPDRSWRAMLDNDIEIILGQFQLEERLERFVLAYRRKLVDERDKIATIDLRYTNGLAVSWKRGLNNFKLNNGGHRIHAQENRQ
jgi:cell division protein FtsQ